MFNYRKYIPIILSIAIILLTSTIIYFILQNRAENPIQIDNALATNIDTKNDENNLKNIIHQSQKSVVQIESSSDMHVKNGSGFLINNKGDIMTNAHVVEGAETITVTLGNTRQYPAAIVGIGKTQDIAIIRVPELNHMASVKLETEHHAEIGDEIIAIGSPLGIQNSVSLGFIVGTDRSFSINDFQYEDVYQISASITHGNSGGPLISRETGKVIGMNSAGISDTDIGFSVPISQVSNKVFQWIEDVDESKLNYLSPTDTTISPKKLKEDSLYITDYLFDNISNRDYVNAYSTLGSNKQDKMSYTDFRLKFQSDIHVVVKDKIIQKVKQDKVYISVNLEVTIRNDSYHEETVKQSYKLVTGYENDQIKIINLTQK